MICFSLVKLLFDTYDNIQLHILLHILVVYRKQMILMKSSMKENKEIKKRKKRKKKGNIGRRNERKKGRIQKLRKKKEKELRN